MSDTPIAPPPPPPPATPPIVDAMVDKIAALEARLAGLEAPKPTPAPVVQPTPAPTPVAPVVSEEAAAFREFLAEKRDEHRIDLAVKMGLKLKDENGNVLLTPQQALKILPDFGPKDDGASKIATLIQQQPALFRSVGVPTLGATVAAATPADPEQYATKSGGLFKVDDLTDSLFGLNKRGK